MGILEKRVEDRLRRTKLNTALILAISAAGIIAVGALAPALMGALGKTKLLPQERYRAKTAVGRMIKKGYLKSEQKDGKPHLVLTEKGERFALLMKSGETAPARQKRWDGKWRIVTYDFRGQASTLRSRVRELLRTWGFAMLHQSVWVYPYDCEDLIVILKHEFKLGNGFLYLIAEEIEGDTRLRSHFNLLPRR